MSESQRRAIDDLMRGNPLDIGGDLRVQRPILDHILAMAPVPDDVVVTPRELGGVSALEITVEDRMAHGIVLYLHGGAFSMGSASGSVGLAAEVARRAQMTVFSLDYRLAPEHPYPAALDDVVAAMSALLTQSGDVPVFIVGESAGGNLAISSMIALRERSTPLPRAAVVMSPWLDLELTGASMQTLAHRDPALTEAGLRVRAHDYLAGTDPALPTASPLRASLQGLPPVLIQAGSHEVLLDDSVRFAGHASAAHVAVTLEVTPGVPHVFQGFFDGLDEGSAALDRVGRFLRSHAEQGSHD